MNHCWGVITGVLALASRVGQYRCAQHIVRIEVSTTYAFIHHVSNTHRGVWPLHIHTNFEKHYGNTGVLTHRAMTFRTHAAIGQDLGNCIFCRTSLLELIGLSHSGNEVLRVVVGNELKGIRNALNEVVLFDICHGFLLISTLLVRFDLF